jgi:hypothetical protein
MVPYWHEAKPTALAKVMSTVRQWLLVALVGWVVGWQLMDVALRHDDLRLGVSPVVAQADISLDARARG